MGLPDFGSDKHLNALAHWMARMKRVRELTEQLQREGENEPNAQARAYHDIFHRDTEHVHKEKEGGE